MIRLPQSAIDDILTNYIFKSRDRGFPYFAEKYEISEGSVREVLRGAIRAKETMKPILRKKRGPDVTLQIIVGNPGIAIGRIVELTGAPRPTIGKRLGILCKQNHIVKYGPSYAPVYYVAGTEPKEPYVPPQKPKRVKIEVDPLPFRQFRRMAKPSDFNLPHLPNPTAWIVVQLGAQT